MPPDVAINYRNITCKPLKLFKFVNLKQVNTKIHKTDKNELHFVH